MQFKKAALVLTGQYSVEEYEALVGFWKEKFGVDHIYHWINHEDKLHEFDDLLIRGDKNPNTRGLLKTFEKMSIKAKKPNADFSDFDLVMVAGPENQWTFGDIHERASAFAKASLVVWLSACQVEEIEQVKGHFYLIPLKTFAEKSGTFVNFQGKEQSFEKVDLFIQEAFSLVEITRILKGEEQGLETMDNISTVNNEFIYQRGVL